MPGSRSSASAPASPGPTSPTAPCSGRSTSGWRRSSPARPGRADLEDLDVAGALRATLLPRGAVAELERLAPPDLVLPSGRRVPIDYGAEGGPAARVRVQQLFGVGEHPTVLGGQVPVVLHLLSPADRPVQVTADLPGFWSGSWAEVRKAMAGRYPKHPWPEDPTAPSGP